MSDILRTGLKVIVACLAVGFVLSLFGLDAWGALRVVSDAFHWVVDNATGLVREGGRYILLGAVIVVPIFLIKLALSTLKKRN